MKNEKISTMAKPKPPVMSTALLTGALALAGCNAPSLEDLQRVENEVSELRARVEAAEARAKANAASADLALDSAGQCGQVCLQVSDRLDELYRQIMSR